MVLVMKSLKGILILFLILTFAYCNRNKKRVKSNKEVTEQRKGLAESIGFSRIYNKDNKTFENGFVRHVIKYDSTGNIFEEIINNPDGSISTRIFQKYDENGNILESTMYIYSPPNAKYRSIEEIFISQYKYDEKENLAEEINYKSSISNSNLLNKVNYLYNVNNKVVETAISKQGGIKYLREKYMYDSSNNNIEKLEFNPDSTIEYKYIYKFDSNDEVIEEIKYYSGTGPLNSKTTYKYDEDGNKIEEIRYKVDATIDVRITSLYDGNGNKIEEILYDKNNIPTVKTSYEHK